MNIDQKIFSIGRLDVLVDVLRNVARPLVMTNGVFDILHRGHVKYLNQAADCGATLLVAINSDTSVRLLNKGPDRPFNVDDDRAYVLAGLSAVDFVTFFDSKTPVDLIRALRPDVYVKGGDYDMDKLEEAKLVQSWGGSALSLSFLDGYSTTKLVSSVRESKHVNLRKAAFLDRDGVINRDFGYVHTWTDFHFIPGAIEGLRRLQESGYALVVVTNQSGIARGLFSNDQYQLLTEKMCAELRRQGVYLDGVYHCPHYPGVSIESLSTGCSCRKPAPGMILQAASELGLSLSESLLIGDKPADIDAARAAGVGRAYLVFSDNAVSTQRYEKADACFFDLLTCVLDVLPESRKV